MKALKKINIYFNNDKKPLSLEMAEKNYYIFIKDLKNLELPYVVIGPLMIFKNNINYIEGVY